MKQMPILLGCALLIALPPFAGKTLAAPAPAPAAKAADKAPTPAELQRLRQSNKSKAEKVLRDLQNAGRNMKKGGLAPIKPLVEQALAFLKLPETERPETLTPSYIHRRIAEAISNPINLRLLPEITDHLDEAAKTAKTPAEKAEAAYAKARIFLLNGLDDKAADHEKVMLAAFADRSLRSSRRLDLMKNAIENGPLYDLDFDRIAWDAVQDDPKAHYDFYRYALRIDLVRNRANYNRLRKDCGPEHVITLCDRALADPAVGYKRDLINAKAEALLALRQPAQAEKFLVGYTTSTNANIRHDAFLALGDHYLRTARRYYGDPEPETLKKAIKAYEGASDANKRSTKPILQAGLAALQLKDYDRAIRAYEEIIPREGGRTNALAAKGLGDSYYGKKDWEKAAFYYGLHPDRLPSDSLYNYCKSLFLLKRYEETARWLEKYSKTAWGRYAKKEGRYLLQEVRKRIEAEKSPEGTDHAQ